MGENLEFGGAVDFCCLVYLLRDGLEERAHQEDREWQTGRRVDQDEADAVAQQVQLLLDHANQVLQCLNSDFSGHNSDLFNAGQIAYPIDNR